MTGLIDAYSQMRNKSKDPSSSYYKESIPKGHKLGALQNFSPEQMQLFKQLFGNLGPDSYLSKLADGDESMFDEIEAPALRQFGQIQSGIANRYSGMGLGGRKSSGFQNEQTAAASNFAQQLQANRQGLQNQAVKDLVMLSSQLLGQKPMNRYLISKDQQSEGNSGWGGAIGSALGGLGGFALGGPAGAMGGAQLGYGIGSAF